jgi:hypothetical protein
MKVLVKMSLRLSCTLMERCEKISAEYQRFSKSRVDEHDLMFSCENKEAIDFVRWADFFVPGTGPQIQILSTD